MQKNYIWSLIYFKLKIIKSLIKLLLIAYINIIYLPYFKTHSFKFGCIVPNHRKAAR